MAHVKNCLAILISSNFLREQSCARTGGWVKHNTKTCISALPRFQCQVFLLLMPAPPKKQSTRSENFARSSPRPLLRKNSSLAFRIAFPAHHHISPQTICGGVRDTLRISALLLRKRTRVLARRALPSGMLHLIYFENRF